VTVALASPAPSIDPSLLARLRASEAQAIKLAETKSYPEALSVLSEAITLCPSYASAYNNRAQVLQLMAATSSGAAAAAAAAPTPSSSDATAPATLDPVAEQHLRSALSDVDRAIELANGERPILRQAHTQRGLILKALGEDEKALEAYKLGASFGNTFAKTEAVRLNPYAALCNQYLQQALEHHWSGLGAPSSAPAPAAASDAAPASSACAPKQ
jgi:tetratricopeptide (TPR) repeat protein